MSAHELTAVILNSLRGAPWGWALLATVLVALIKAWPVLALQAAESRSKLRQEHRADLTDCQRRLDEMQKRLDAMATAFNDLKIDLSATLSAYRIVDTELAALKPKSLGLAQARAILSTAFTVAPSTGPDK